MRYNRACVYVCPSDALSVVIDGVLDLVVAGGLLRLVVEGGDERVLQCLLGRDALVRIELKQLPQAVECLGCGLRDPTTTLARSRGVRPHLSESDRGLDGNRPSSLLEARGEFMACTSSPVGRPVTSMMSCS